MVFAPQPCWELVPRHHTHQSPPDQPTATPPGRTNVATEDHAHICRRQEWVSADDVQDRTLAGTELPFPDCATHSSQIDRPRDARPWGRLLLRRMPRRSWCWHGQPLVMVGARERDTP